MRLLGVRRRRPSRTRATPGTFEGRAGDVEVAGLNGVGARCLVRHGLENDRRIGPLPTPIAVEALKRDRVSRAHETTE